MSKRQLGRSGATEVPASDRIRDPFESTEAGAGPAERIRFRTEMGSVYEISCDAAGMRWQRLSTTLASGQLRSEGGPLAEWPEPRVGERCEMVGEPFTPPFLRRVVTSVVVAILARQGSSIENRNADRRVVRGAIPGATAAEGVLEIAETRRLLPIDWPSFREVRPGDRVTRMMAGLAMPLRATSVDDGFIYCGPPGVGWKFDRDTGIEVDEELGWGPPPARIGTYLVPALLDGEERPD
jgi:hypothetical protein